MSNISTIYKDSEHLFWFVKNNKLLEEETYNNIHEIEVESDISDFLQLYRVITDLKTFFPDKKISSAFAENTASIIHINFIQIETGFIKPDIPSKKVTETTSGILEALYTELIEKNRIIESFNHQLTDSLKYASKIQKAMIPSGNYINKIFPQSFILYQPLHYVSGDFYWFYEAGLKTYFAVADCTGHGVSGALMSILGISLLNEISNVLSQSPDISASDILNLLRSQIISSLHNEENESEILNGMDIAICVLDREKFTLQYSGALIPLYIVRNTKLLEFKPNRMPIGNYPLKQSFTDIEITLEPSDLIYLFTDGYPDQFGGANNKKLLRINFKKLLTSISPKSLNEQKSLLKELLYLWKNSNGQTDDITGIGIKVEEPVSGLYSI